VEGWKPFVTSAIEEWAKGLVTIEKPPIDPPVPLRKPQIRILVVLSKAKSPLNRKMVAEAAKVNVAWCTEYLGSLDLEQNAKIKARTGYKTLIGYGYAKAKEVETEGKKQVVYEITESGRDALENAQDEGGPDDGPERDRLRLTFWKGLLSRCKAKGTRHANLTPSESSWIAASSGVRGVPFIYIIRKDKGKVELSINRGTGQAEANKRIYDQLYSQKNEIEEIFGSKLSWHRLDDKLSSRITYTIPVGGYNSDESKWPEIQDAMIGAMIRLEKALTPYLSRLKTEL
jgi:DNA-binding MarR family transcriptional regulator